jgi:shikimate dehydrogenase
VNAPISGTTRLAAVIGSPVRHSLSPAIHNAAFEAAGLDWRLVALEVEPGSGAQAVAAMKTLGIYGFAVTTPHKSDVAAAVDEVDPAALALRSVNTVVLRDDGTTYGASTDGGGFVDSVVACGVELSGARVVVLGSGAAARSVIDALGRAGVSDLAILNRSPASAHEAAELADAARVGSPDDVAGATLLVNATTVGMGSRDMPIDAALLHPGLMVADLVYHPIRTALLAAAESAGARCIDGLGMLVHQAIRQQQLWTGSSPDPIVVRAAAEAELARRNV